MPEEHDPELETTRETPVGDDPEVVAGRYRIVRTLGRGGGGIVWLAHDQHLGREVALKRVAGEADAEVLVTRGLREARTSAALAHHHVVRVYDAFVHDGSPWIVMEYVPGPSLSALLEGGRSLPVRQVARIGAQVATALAAAHGAGVVHRDIKPGNVLLTDETGQDAKLTDFGIARAEDDHQLTRTGMVSGTAAYFSPELARGEDPSAASDLWALGATLYAAVEGRRPYPDAGNPVAQLHMIARDAPEEPRRAGPLGPVLRGLLDPDPARRWTAEQAARALTEVAEGRPVAGAGAAGGPAAAVAGAAGAGGAPGGTWAGTGTADDRTQMVTPGTTRQVPAGRAAPAGRAPAEPVGSAEDHTYAARPPASARPTSSREVTEGRRAAPARARRRPRTPVAVVLGWVIGLLLALLLGWLLWTIASGNLPGTDDTPTATATEGQPVGVEEAEGTVRAFYTALQDEGLAAAREHLVEGVPVDDAIAEGLDSVEVSDVSSTELDGGVVQTVVTATYTYGPCVIVQEETMQVGRRGTEALIVRRVTQTMSTSGCREESVETGEGAGGSEADARDEAADRAEDRDAVPGNGAGSGAEGKDDKDKDDKGKGDKGKKDDR